jgi:hypothetical protein
MNRWGAPPENQVYADPDGTIAWKTGGLTPIRPNWVPFAQHESLRSDLQSGQRG